MTFFLNSASIQQFFFLQEDIHQIWQQARALFYHLKPQQKSNNKSYHNCILYLHSRLYNEGQKVTLLSHPISQAFSFPINQQQIFYSLISYPKEDLFQLHVVTLIACLTPMSCLYYQKYLTSRSDNMEEHFSIYRKLFIQLGNLGFFQKLQQNRVLFKEILFINNPLFLVVLVIQLALRKFEQFLQEIYDFWQLHKIIFIQMAQPAGRNIKIICRSGTSVQREVLTSRPPDKKQSKNSEKDSESIFTGKLDYRDEVISVPITFIIDKATYLNNPSYYQQQLLQWLVVVVQNIFSITFRYLLQQKLSILEAKAYACKNILLNIKEMCEYLSTDIGATIDDAFLKKLDSNLSEIISTVINKYPQTNAKSASKKVLKFIKQISNRDNDQFDFLFNHNLNIKYKTNGDYSSEIMTVINKILNLPMQQVKQDQNLFENFKKFCLQLFYFSKQQYNEKAQENTVQIVDQSIDALLNSGKNALRSYEVLQDRQVEMHKSDFFKDMANSLITEDYQISQDLLNFQKNKKNLFGINQKIPSEVKQFCQKQYKEGQFKVYHSSILRVLTKWSQQLYEKLQKADDNIRSRIHKFKNNSQTLRFCSVEQKQQLYTTALKQKCRVDEYLQNLKDQNKILQSSFVVQNLSGKYIKKFTNVNVFAGKLQEMVCHYTFRYLNRLIHSLLSIPIASGEKLYEKYKILQDKQYLADQILKQLSDINLVTFKVGDLLRAKYSCQQHQFINILCLLYKIQQIQPNFLKIVKIKNRMFEKDNDILINFYFRNRSICELQLSIHKEQNKKEKLYSEFNHFIYELKRSQFGIISQISSIIAQHDPIVNYFTFFRHKPPTVIQKSKKHISHVNSRSKSLIFRRTISDGVYLNHKIYQKTIQRPFICENCRNLKTVLNPKFYYREDDQCFCNDCIQKLMYEKPTFRKNIIKDLFKYYILDEKLDQFTQQIYLWNYADTLSNIRSEKQLYVDFIDYGFVIQKQDKLPKVRFFKIFYNYMKNSVVLSTISNGEIDNFLSLNSSKQKDRYQFYNTLQKYLFFGFKTNNQGDMIKIAKNCISQQNSEQDCIKTLNIKQKQFLMKEYIKTVLNSFEKYHTTLYLNGYRYIMQCIFEYLHDSNQIKSSKRISLFQENASRITSMLLQSSDIFSLYPFITYFSNTREINLSNNHIKSIQILQNFKKLQSLNISHNHINSIECLNKMSWIEIIIAAENQITELNGVSLMTSLKVANFNQNKLSHIHDLDGLYSLQELYANKNFIIQMKGLQNLRALQILDLSNNNIVKIQALQKLTQLKSINIASNFISQMINFETLHKLSILNLSNNSISAITRIQTRSIKDLDLSTNIIQQITNLSHLDQLNSLNLAKNNIHKIQNLQQLQKLKKLILNDNQITSLEDNQFPKYLQYLTFENNPIEQIQNINFLRNMASLSFEHCQLTKIQQISKLKKLKSLSLSFNSINQIKQIDQLVRLQKLDISNNKIKKIQNLNSLKYLQNLSLANNFIPKIQNLQQLLQLNWLVLTRNKITKIEGLDNLTELKCLQLQQNQIEEIAGLDYLQELEELMLASNRISKICNFNSLTNLKKLSLGGNQITSICGLSKMVNLELLDLQMNHISKIQNLNSLLELKWLILSNNQIEKLQGLERLEQLSKLFISKNKIAKIENLSQLKVLTVLFLDFNLIEKIEGFQQMPNLEKLNLSNNKIATIEGLQKLEQLNQLNLQSNLITKIQNMQPLQKLKRLNLAHNKLTSVDNLHSLKQLTYLQISANSIQQISNIHNLPYLQFINLSDNPVNNNLQTYNRLNQHVKLCIQLIMQKFDSQTLRRTIHKKVASDIKDNKEEKQLGNRVKMIKSFAKSFSPQF